ncbi:transglycosylase SLT domain-containing protein [Campylobacter devanensis]|uniref:transglycosylase SLT domain-containing protein n=1 Tax=Campylobacter devanensis TaxID=3161138 RepID=UPI000A338FDE|nr:transglycosylase SLT domain-containing protein [Campylobacter sp. P0108]
MDIFLYLILSYNLPKPHYLQEFKTIYTNMYNKNIAKAIYTYQASKAYNIDSKLLTTLINSESSYRANSKHSLNYVSGLAGINSRYWNIPNKSIKEQIFAGAYVLRHYLNRYKGDTLKALTAYKGISNLGRRQAKAVYKRYLKIS